MFASKELTNRTEKLITLALITFLAVILAYSTGHAQKEKRFGFYAGQTVSSFDTTESSSSQFGDRRGLSIGTFFDSAVGPNVAIQLRTSFIEKGGSYDLYDSPLSGELKIKYIETAAYLKLRPGRSKIQPYLLVGPYVAYQLEARISGEANGQSASEDVSNYVSTTDFGFDFGAGIQTSFLFAEAQYKLGLSNIFSASGFNEFNNQGFQVIAGLSFGGRNR